MRRPLLPITTATALLLLLPPALLLWRLPRPQAQGLERLLPQMALLQSLPALPSRPVPKLWIQRLGAPRAERLWRQQRRLWWQGWGRHGDAGAYLVLSLGSTAPLPQAQLPPQSLQLNDLLVVAADPLALRLLQDQLRLVQRPLRGLDRRCLSLLQGDQAVFWKPAGLAGLMGPLAPLLQRFQEGCLALSVQESSLAFSGEASASPDVLLPALGGDEPELPSPLQPPRQPALLLELQGSSLQPLLQGLLSRQLVRESLAARYAIGGGQLELLRRLPFRLRLRPLSRGPFRAGLELQLAVGGQRPELARLLEELRRRLRQQGLDDFTPPSLGALPDSRVLPAASWRREDGVVVGGWRWLAPAGADPELLLFLGPVPPIGGQAPLGRAAAVDRGALTLRLWPAGMAAAGLWPEDVPSLLRQARSLELASRSAGGSLSRLRGRLLLAPR